MTTRETELITLVGDIVEACESGEFEGDIFLRFISEGHTKGFKTYLNNYFKEDK